MQIFIAALKAASISNSRIRTSFSFLRIILSQTAASRTPCGTCLTVLAQRSNHNVRYEASKIVHHYFFISAVKESNRCSCSAHFINTQESQTLTNHKCGLERQPNHKNSAAIVDSGSSRARRRTQRNRICAGQRLRRKCLAEAPVLPHSLAKERRE
jgi:hypothetical protein